MSENENGPVGVLGFTHYHYKAGNRSLSVSDNFFIVLTFQPWVSRCCSLNTAWMHSRWRRGRSAWRTWRSPGPARRSPGLEKTIEIVIYWFKSLFNFDPHFSDSSHYLSVIDGGRELLRLLRRRVGVEVGEHLPQLLPRAEPDLLPVKRSTER